jgi:hypothetical protein
MALTEQNIFGKYKTLPTLINLQKTSIAWNNDNLYHDLTVNGMNTSEHEHNLSDTQN